MYSNTLHHGIAVEPHLNHEWRVGARCKEQLSLEVLCQLTVLLECVEPGMKTCNDLVS